MGRRRAIAAIAAALVGVAALLMWAWWPRAVRGAAQATGGATEAATTRAIANAGIAPEATEDVVVYDSRAEDAGAALRAEVVRILCMPRAEILCDAAEHCGCGLDHDDCIAEAVEDCARHPSRISLDPADADRCLALYRENAPTCFPRIHCGHGPSAGACSDRGSTPGGAGEQTCSPFAPPGAACGSDHPCAPDSACRHGVCTRWDATGTACERDDECGPTTMCRDGRCIEHATEGAACAQRADCLPADTCVGGVCRRADRCTRDEQCGAQAHCAEGTVRSRCERKRRVGEPCTRDECEDGAMCDRLRDQCVALPRAGENCRHRACATGFFCEGDDDGRVCMPAQGEGERCRRGEFSWTADSCGVGMRCLETQDGTLHCARRPLGHESCESDEDCSSAEVCLDSRCVRLKTIGETGCEELGCESPALCVDDRCVAPPTLGQGCEYDCADGLTCVREHVGGRCVPDACDSML